MSTESDDPDDQLVDRLRVVAQELDPPPGTLLLAASELFGLRTVDAELAELVADSLDSAGAVRSSATAVRLLSFTWSDLALELEVAEEGATRRLLGELTGASGDDVLVDSSPGRTLSVQVDPFGRFEVSGVPAGLVRLRLTAADGTAVVTAWTRI